MLWTEVRISCYARKVVRSIDITSRLLTISTNLLRSHFKTSSEIVFPDVEFDRNLLFDLVLGQLSCGEQWLCGTVRAFWCSGSPKCEEYCRRRVWKLWHSVSRCIGVAPILTLMLWQGASTEDKLVEDFELSFLPKTCLELYFCTMCGCPILCTLVFYSSHRKIRRVPW